MNLVIVGFGNSQGQMVKKIHEEHYHVIERMNIKPAFAAPIVKCKKIPEIDLGIAQNLIAHKRHQTLLAEFIGLNDQEDIRELHDLKKVAQREVDVIDDELNTIKFLTQDARILKFRQDTGASEADSILYLQQFEQNAVKAVEKYKEHQSKVKRFSDTYKISESEARSILRANNYNESLFN